MRSAVTSLLEVLGAGAVTVGAATAAPAAGWVVGGAFCLWFARGLTR